MKFADYVDKYGVLPTFHIEDEINASSLDKNKPSSRIFYSKQGLKAIAALKNIEKNHNHSWYQELLNRNKDNMNETALFYRGRKITFQEMFDNSDKLAKSLYSEGIRKGDEIPACLANTPEAVYLMLAANRIGAKVNFFGPKFDHQYINKILNDCTNKVIFASDDMYKDIEEVVRPRKYNNKVIISLADSLPKSISEIDEYEQKLDKYYHYENKVKEYATKDNSISTFSNYVKLGASLSQSIPDNNNLETPFLVTYTSGSTTTGFPKGIIHNNRSLIVSGAFHDAELSGNPKIKGLRGLAHIHTESNTDLISGISDNLMQGWSTALEPEYDKNKFFDYLLIDKPNYANASTSFIVNIAKQYLVEKKYHEDGVGRKLPFLLALFAAGEPISQGEEKLINKFLKEAKAGSGIKIKGVSLPYTTISIGGGDCEHGGIYYSLWRSLFQKLNKIRLSKGIYGMKPVPYAQVSAFKPTKDDKFTECNYNETGIIAANSITNMLGYKDNIKDLKQSIITDTRGRDWLSSNVYGYVDEIGGVHVKSRVGTEIKLSNGNLIAPYIIEDIVNKDTKNILSCTVSKTCTENGEIPIVNIEFQPFKKKNDISVLQSVLNRCENNLSSEVSNQILFRIFDNSTSFPLTPSGKRSFKELDTMKDKNTFKIINGKVVPHKVEKTENTKIYLKK